MRRETLKERIESAVYIAESDGDLFANKLNEVLAEAKVPQLSQLGTPLCLDVEGGAEIAAFGVVHPDMVATEPVIANELALIRDEAVVTGALEEFGKKGVTVIRARPRPAIKSLPPEKTFGFVTWLRIYPTSVEPEYLLSVIAAAGGRLTENGVMIASTVEDDETTRRVLAKIAGLISEKVPGMEAKFIETSLGAIGCLFIVAKRKS